MSEEKKVIPCDHPENHKCKDCPDLTDEQREELEKRQAEVNRRFKLFSRVHDLVAYAPLEDAEQELIELSTAIEGAATTEMSKRELKTLKVETDSKNMKDQLEALKDVELEELQVAINQVSNAINMHCRHAQKGKTLKELGIRTYKEEK